jgi:hypothetical protein
MDRELEHARADLLHRWQKAAAGVSKKQHATVATARVWLKRASGPSNADWISNELVRPGAFSATLKRNLVYLRGSLDELKTPAGIEATLRESTKDAFIFCLLDPPESRDEKTVLSRVRTAYGGGAPMQEATRHVHRLGDALLGLPILRSEWRSNIEDAEDHQSLGHWKSTFDLAPLRGAQRAAKASLLLVVVDEPGEGPGPTELDGERPHFVRVSLVDLVSNRRLLQLRRHVDPSFISTEHRSRYARGADGCALAYEVHQAVAG